MKDKVLEKILLFRVERQQDTDSFATLYDKYVERIYRFVYFKVGTQEEAEDITSEVFLKAWNYLREKKDIKSFSGFLYRIARNLIIDFYRARAAQPEILSTDRNENAEGEEAEADKWYAESQVESEMPGIVVALKKLKQEYQEVLTLKYVDGLSINEIAEITGKGAISVRVTQHRALKKLKQILEVV